MMWKTMHEGHGSRGRASTLFKSGMSDYAYVEYEMSVTVGRESASSDKMNVFRER